MAVTVASPLPLWQLFNNQGQFNVGGSVLTQVGGVNAPTYQDAAGTIALPNPIPLNSRGEISDASGHSQQLFLATDTVYVFTVFDKNGNQLDQVQHVTGPTITQSQFNTLLEGSPPYIQTPLEAAASVTPVDYFIAPYNVLRYGATGNGSTDDTAAFNLAGSIRHAIAVPDTGNTYVLSSLVTGMFYAIGQPRFTTNYQRIGLVTEVGVPLSENNSGVVGSFQGLGAVLMIGDSITQGVGATTYVDCYAWAVGRSILNATEEGVFADDGNGYHRITNMGNFITSPGVTNNGGTIVAAGLWQSRLNLTGSNTLQISLREINAFYVIYDCTASAGATFTIELNGAVILTQAVSGSGLFMSGVPVIKTNNYRTRLTDVITVTATVGTLQVCGVYDVKNSGQEACNVIIGGEGGFAYQDFNSTAAFNEMAFYVVNPSVPLSCLVICNLGTNNMYNASKALSPAATVAQIDAVLTGIVNALTAATVQGIQLAIAMPPRSNEALFPMILTQYRYEDYVRAIVSYALQHNVTLIRHDLGALNSGSYYADGLHPNDVGHTIFAQTTLSAIGIRFNRFFKSLDYATSQYLCDLRNDTAPAMNSTWGPYTASANYACRAHLEAGMVYLSGVVIPNASSSTTVATLPTGFQPDGGNRYFSIPKNVTGGTGGTARLTINSSGQLILDAVPSNDVALDGVSFPLNKYIES